MKGRARSVDRNEIRRQVRESFRKIGAELGSRDYNVVISLQRQVRHPFPRQLAKVLQEEWPKRLKEKKAI
jgi:ribonuclease P protein component